MLFYDSEDSFVDKILKPLADRIAIRYMEFPGEQSPIVFVRLAAVTRYERGPVFCRLDAPVSEGRGTDSWDIDFTFYPESNWESAGKMLSAGRNWEKAHRVWHAAQHTVRVVRPEWLIQACRADRPFVANPAEMKHFPEFAPIDLTDPMFRCKLYALLHMIPCYLSTGLLHGMENRHRAAMIRKLQDRLSGYLRSTNKTG